MPSKQTKGYNPSHDIEFKAGRRVNWKNDLAIGHKGEDIVKDFLKCLDKQLFEVKFDQYRNGRMVVEVQQNPGRKGWKPSRLDDDGSQVVGVRVLTAGVHSSRSGQAQEIS